MLSLGHLHCTEQIKSVALSAIVFAVPGLRFKHKNPDKVVTSVAKKIFVNHPSALWHNVVSNSLTVHPSNCKHPSTSKEVLEGLKLNCTVPYIKVGKSCRQFLEKHQWNEIWLLHPPVELEKRLLQNAVNIRDLIEMTKNKSKPGMNQPSLATKNKRKRINKRRRKMLLT